MSRICPETGNETRCTGKCIECARDLCEELRKKVGNAEKVTQEEIIDDLSENAFNMLEQYGFIKPCHLDELNRHWYTIAKKFTVYAWFADDEAGTGVCLTGDFNKYLGYRPETGPWAKPSEKLGEFNTVKELADILFVNKGKWYRTKEEALEAAIWKYEHYPILRHERWYI